MKKYKLYIFILLLLMIIPVSYGAFYMTIFGIDHFFEPEIKKIKLIPGGEISFEFLVKKICTHKIGIMFYGKSHEHIKNVFDSSFPYITLPADLDIKITNSNNQVNFKKVNFGGKNKDGLAYGPNPIRFIAGRPQLTPGKYVVDIKTNEIREDIAQLDIYFFASIPQKIKCGKFKKLEK